MNKRKLLQIGLAAAGLLPLWPAGAGAGLVFADVQGKVLYRASDDGAWAPAAPGAAVREGAGIRTGRLSWTELRYDDNSTVALGPDTEFVLYTARPADRYARLVRGFYKAVVRKTDRKFLVRTPAASAAVRGTRFTLTALKGGTTRARVFSGVVAVTDAAGAETLVKPDELLTADAEGAGAVVPSRAASLPGGWTLEPPAGFTPGRQDWTLKTGEEAGFPFKGRPVTLERFERLSGEEREVDWKTGRGWPAACPGKGAPRELRAGLLDGKPLFTYACPPQDLSGGERQHRYFEVPVLNEEGRAVSAMRLHYSYHVRPVLPPAAELRRLYGGRGSAGDQARDYARGAAALAAEAGAGGTDGPGLDAVVRSALTLYREGWGADKGSYTGKVVPLIE